MNPDTRIVNAKTTTKAELIRLNAALAAENAELRNLTTDLRETLAHKVAEPIIKPLFAQLRTATLNKQAQELAVKMRARTRVHEGKIEVYLHGGWNDLSTVAVTVAVAVAVPEFA